MFGSQKRIEGKIVKGKNGKWLKVSRKWMQSKMIVLFGMNESNKKVKGKKYINLINDINTPH